MAIKHIKGLDSIRAIAAVAVMLSHIEIFLNQKGYEINSFIPTGHTGVVLFFVLSGFLITTLLVNEKEANNTVSIKKFYMRRIYRVWPLYFLIILLSWILTDFTPEISTLILCLTIFPNVAHAMVNGWAPSPQIWSIGVEEQFYLVLPILVKKINTKYLSRLLLFLFLGFSILPHLTLFCLNKFYPDEELMTFVNKFFYGTKYSVMAFGGYIGILFLNYRAKIESIFKNGIVLLLSVTIPFILWFIHINTKYFTDEIYGILFSCLILAISSNQDKIKNEFKITKFLGKISYGIYMYHWLILILITNSGIINFGSYPLDALVLYSSTISLTIIISHISFKYFETRFLKLKAKFSS